MSIEKQQEEFEKLKGELSERENSRRTSRTSNAEKYRHAICSSTIWSLHLGHVIGT
jgi:hypothetical protein